MRRRKRPSVKIEGEDDITDEAKTLGREAYGELASPYITPYRFNKQFLDNNTVSERSWEFHDR